MASATYTLCALVALLCSYLLLSAYSRQGYRLLLWSGLCFVGFTANNILLVLDKIVLPQVDLSIWRNSVALGSIMILLYGLIWDAE
jgi:hydrogenase/urease accessory protein HupE